MSRSPLQKLEFSSDVLDAMNALKAAGAVPKWGCESPEAGAAGTTRQNKFNGELKMAGIKVRARWIIGEGWLGGASVAGYSRLSWLCKQTYAVAYQRR